MRVEHQKVQLFFAVFVVDSGNKHTLRRNSHHGSWRQICDGDARFSDQFFRLVVIVNAGKDDSIRAGTVIQNEFQEFLGLFDCLAGFDLHGAEIGFRERLEVHKVLKERLDLHMGEVDDFFFRRSSRIRGR